MMPPSLRNVLRKVVPRTLRQFHTNRSLGNIQKQKEAEPLLFSLTNGTILAGPFEGLQYCDEACGSMLGPKLLGVYEKELSTVVETIKKISYEHIIDIGAAEGYYAIGFLRACPASLVTAFEATPEGRRTLERIAAKNHVLDRLTLLGYCDSSDLQTVLGRAEKELLICDIEGGEKHLLNPQTIPSLISTDILVELHDFVDVSISSTLFQRFSPTHHIERFQSKLHTFDELPRLAGLDKSQLLLLASEQRPCRMEWFWMRAKTQSH